MLFKLFSVSFGKSRNEKSLKFIFVRRRFLARLIIGSQDAYRLGRRASKIGEGLNCLSSSSFLATKRLPRRASANLFRAKRFAKRPLSIRDAHALDEEGFPRICALNSRRRSRRARSDLLSIFENFNGLRRVIISE